MIKDIVKKQRQFHNEGQPLNYEFRMNALIRLEQSLKYHESEILDALTKDLGKSHFEGYMAEVGMVYEELAEAKKKLKLWMKGKYVSMPLSHFPAVGEVTYEPYGVVLIMSPWNYPFALTMEPLIGAICAGNCAVIKPSAYSKTTSNVIAEVIDEAFPEKYITTVIGGRAQNQDLLDQKFDYIFFTGGKTVGRIVMEKAAKHLTPVTLELGGKSPCIVDETANLKITAKRIVFGKFLNSGQTCVAPDYVLVNHKVKKELLKWLRYWIVKMYGKNPLSQDDYPKMIDEKHFQSVVSLIDRKKVFYGGIWNTDSLQIAPTLLVNVKASDPVMQEEIFGPILPIISYNSLDSVKRFINAREKPLALYLFTRRKRTVDKITKEVSFGGGCINDTIMHVGTTKLAFGGVGESGMGSYHGKESFKTFSHKKSMVKKPFFLDVPVRYQPYSKIKETLMKFFMKL